MKLCVDSVWFYKQYLQLVPSLPSWNITDLRTMKLTDKYSGTKFIALLPWKYDWLQTNNWQMKCTKSPAKASAKKPSVVSHDEKVSANLAAVMRSYISHNICNICWEKDYYKRLRKHISQSVLSKIIDSHVCEVVLSFDFSFEEETSICICISRKMSLHGTYLW